MKTVYYFGAGASYGALPVLGKLTDDISKLATSLEEFFLNDEEITPELRELESVAKDLIGDLRWLVIQSENHQTVDTLAKRFYLTSGYNELWRLKRALISYFQIKQLFTTVGSKFQRKISLDKRYDSLIATIAEKDGSGIKLRSGYGVVTWNYDVQFELALSGYETESRTINAIKRRHQIFPVKGLLDRSNYSCDHKSFTMFKLNGNALWDEYLGAINEPIPTTIDMIMRSRDVYESIALVLKGYFNSNSEQRYFNYSWELVDSQADGYPARNNVIEDAALLVKSAATLIVVGYSFPAFNEEIDKRILRGFSGRRIIIQDMNPAQIELRMKSLVPSFADYAASTSSRTVRFEHDVVDPSSAPAYFPFA